MKRKQGDFKGETYTTVFQKKWDFSPTDYVQNAIFSKTPLFLAPLIKKKRGNAHRRLPGIGPGGRWLDTTSRVNC